MKPATFKGILELIQHNDVFQNNSNNPQMDVWIQLAIAMYRFRHYGNVATMDDIAEWAGVSAGTVYNCTLRVETAILDLHDHFIHPPDAAMKEASKEYCKTETCGEWEDGHSSGDGTTIDLNEKPGHYGEAYFDKSSSYSLNLQVSISHIASFLCFANTVNSRSSICFTIY